jgi:D-arabinose 1-dehydrogenase-like Zn-dependent alcohol dehydrogenase
MKKIGGNSVQQTKTAIPETMLAARLHAVGQPMRVDTIATPRPGPTDILLQVKACGVVPNLRNVLDSWQTWFPHQPLPDLPATFGLDAAGVVAEVGERVHDIMVGERVYVNPLRGCGSCRACRSDQIAFCRSAVFQGYFGFGSDAQMLFDDYPHGGLGQYLAAPQSSVVKLPANVSFEQAARFGYLGTSYSALSKSGIRPGQTLLINGVSGTLGVGAVAFALAVGVTRILGTAQDHKLLERVKALAPSRIEVFSTRSGSVADWSKRLTGGEGVDVAIDSLAAGAPPAATLDALRSVRKGGRMIIIGGVSGDVPVNVKWLMDNSIQIIGSLWFSTAEGQEIADMAAAGTLDLSIFQPKTFPLSQVNDLIKHIGDREGGFTNFVVVP